MRNNRYNVNTSLVNNEMMVDISKFVYFIILVSTAVVDRQGNNTSKSRSAPKCSNHPMNGHKNVVDCPRNTRD